MNGNQKSSESVDAYKKNNGGGNGYEQMGVRMRVPVEEAVVSHMALLRGYTLVHVSQYTYLHCRLPHLILPKKKKKKKVVIQDPTDDDVVKLAEKIESLSVPCIEADVDSLTVLHTIVMLSFLTLVNLFQVRNDTLSDENENVVDDLDDLIGEDEEGEGIILQPQFPWEGCDKDYEYEEVQLLGFVFNILLLIFDFCMKSHCVEDLIVLDIFSCLDDLSFAAALGLCLPFLWILEFLWWLYFPRFVQTDMSSAMVARVQIQFSQRRIDSSFSDVKQY
ncbi:hypothetical protein RHGRI_017338 [Rhododendron griersonianum]|uniref:Uncharacterized protein n=1 Tax=Rhododendron griersonianum TaxID=479676 RepID=A0AAV6JXJ1_9ERIC|nr:hypothetical protein RHGRI_017338 [Rhododendron griersonianum]